MSTSEDVSLLGHLNAPVLVGDPDGCIVYANPAFRLAFCMPEDDPVGQPMAMVFGGGAREQVLSVTASVLGHGEAARLQIREGGTGYTGLASPIKAEDDRVGVVMVLLEEQSNDEYLTALAEEINEPIVEAVQSIQAIGAKVGDLLLDDQRDLFDSALRSMENAQKWLRDLQLALRGGKPKQGRFDVSGVVVRVAERASQDLGDRIDLEILMPPNLPRVSGTATAFERLLSQLIRQRINEAESGQPLTLLARTIGDGPNSGVLVSLVDHPDPSRRGATGLPPEAVTQGISAMGGEALCVEDSTVGRVTSMRLSVSAA